jgi:hypothetical protein
MVCSASTADSATPSVKETATISAGKVSATVEEQTTGRPTAAASKIPML